MTPGSQLQRKLQLLDDQFCKLHRTKRWKFVEKVGKKVKDVLGKANPWAGAKCHRADCWPCKEEGQGMEICQAESVVYKLSCKECEKDEIAVEYIGESSRSMYQRTVEHQEGLRTRNKDSTLWQHCLEAHGGKDSRVQSSTSEKA